MKKLTRFVTVTYPNLRYALDYPKDLPIPRIGERLFMDDKNGGMLGGLVEMVSHNLCGNVHEIRIEVKE